MEIDKDLAARQEARLLCRQASDAQKRLAQMSQAQLDAIVEQYFCIKIYLLYSEQRRVDQTSRIRSEQFPRR